MLWIVILWILPYKFCVGICFQFSGLYPEVELLGWVVTFYFTLLRNRQHLLDQRKSKGIPKKKKKNLFTASFIQFSHPVVSDSLQPHGLQHTRPPCPSPTPGVYPNSCSLGRWCYPEARGGGREEQPHPQGGAAAWVQEGWEELLHVQVQEGQLWGDTPHPR